MNEDLIPISAINHYLYCPRRCALIHMEREFIDNAHTLRGHALHENVDEVSMDSDGSVRVERALPLYSEKIGLVSKADVVEFRGDEVPYPVEYKQGRKKSYINDDMQVAAQAMCLEEMTGKPVPAGAIFHFKSRRRREVSFTAKLRQQVEETVKSIRKMLLERVLPPPIDDANKCRECSLIDICQPDLGRANRKIAAQAANLFVPEEEPI